VVALQVVPTPTPWPNANARLLGLGMGLPVEPLVRLAQFSASEFERFTLEWATDYLAKLQDVHEVQQRGGAGDKGRDIIVWLNASNVQPRRWILYQCKHYGASLGEGVAAAEIGKILFYTYRGDYTIPKEYWFVTHKGVTSDFQDLLDAPEKLRQFILTNWDKYCAAKITSKAKVALEGKLRTYIEAFPFSIFRAKQPHDLISEHKQTRYHLTVFGAPLINRPKPPIPPSSVAPAETRYVTQLYKAIEQKLGFTITDPSQFSHAAVLRQLFDRARITFYCAEGLKELARDQMADAEFFNTLLDEFSDGLFHSIMSAPPPALNRISVIIQAAQALQLGAHVLAPHLLANDREGICHHLANDDRIIWG
jgi:hypothetical protein